MVIFDTIRYDKIRIIIVKNTNIHNVHIYTNNHNVHILLFMNTTEECFNYSVLQITKELDKTNLFVKLKKQCTVKFLIRV